MKTITTILEDGSYSEREMTVSEIEDHEIAIEEAKNVTAKLARLEDNE